MKIINLSDFICNWNWLKDEFNNTDQEWLHFSSQAVNILSIIPKKDAISRFITASRAVNEAKKGNSVLVSHGPGPTFYGATIAKLIYPDLPHLACSFNFTDLPMGGYRKLMIEAYKQVSKFITYSTIERKIYSEYFNISIDSIDMLHWAVHKPIINIDEIPIENGRYICALGSQGRDYKTLFRAIKKHKHIKLVVVASKNSILDLEIPENVKIYSNIPLTQAQNILANSDFMVLPLRDSKVPCGHVTIVSGMFYKKAILVTDSKGVHDYIQDEKTGLFFEPNNPTDLSTKIKSLWDDTPKKMVLSEQGLAFANKHCTHENIVNYFDEFILKYR